MTDTITLPRSVVQGALEALENTTPTGFNMESDKRFYAAITALREALEQRQQEQQKSVADGLPPVIAGAIFDFAGYLTTRDKVIKVGSTANASPVADLVKEWAALRGLSLADAAVLSWQELLYTAPPRREWVSLTDAEIKDCMSMSIQQTCRAIEAKLKEKNA